MVCTCKAYHPHGSRLLASMLFVQALTATLKRCGGGGANDTSALLKYSSQNFLSRLESGLWSL